MKKSIFVLAGVAMLALASCKKDYTCDCSITTGGETNTIKADIKGAKKKDAQEFCDAAQATYSQGGSTATCTLK